VGFIAGEVKNPKKVFPTALGVSVLLAIATYSLPMSTSVATYPLANRTDITDGFYPELAANLNVGKWLPNLIIVGCLASNVGTYTAYLHASSNATFDMSKRGTFPPFFSYQLPALKFSSPFWQRRYDNMREIGLVPALLFTVTTVLLSIFDLSVLVEFEALLYASHMIIYCTAACRLRILYPDIERPYKIPGPNSVFFIAAAFPCCVGGVLIYLDVYYALEYEHYFVPFVGAAVVIFGFILYAIKKQFFPHWEQTQYIQAK